MAVSILRLSSTTQMACWISVLPFGPTESQIRPPSMSHVLLFLAIKIHFLFVVLSHVTGLSVMLMKDQSKREQNGDGVESCSWRMFGVGAEGQINGCTRISIVSVYLSNHTISGSRCRSIIIFVYQTDVKLSIYRSSRNCGKPRVPICTKPLWA